MGVQPEDDLGMTRVEGNCYPVSKRSPNFRNEVRVITSNGGSHPFQEFQCDIRVSPISIKHEGNDIILIDIKVLVPLT